MLGPILFVKSELNWSYQTTTNETEKFPKDYEDQEKAMTKQCAYLVRVHNILSE